jgi:hypothetical protein
VLKLLQHFCIDQKNFDRIGDLAAKSGIGIARVPQNDRYQRARNRQKRLEFGAAV